MDVIVEGGELTWRIGPGRTVEIVNIVVTGNRRSGIGRSMVNLLLQEIPRTTSMVYAQTRISNTIAHQFYEGCGFRLIGRLHYFYRDADGAEHALVYGLDL